LNMRTGAPDGAENVAERAPGAPSNTMRKLKRRGARPSSNRYKFTVGQSAASSLTATAV
jgi:hypothetical protein